MRIATIVIYLVLQSTPIHVNEVVAYCAIIELVEGLKISKSL